MIQELAIRDFAIIDNLRVCFSDGLTILSGETGAGKSIIINAVNLLLGSRATADLIRKGAEQAELEARFSVPAGSDVAKMLADSDLAADDGLIIRRVISRADRHRVYINGRASSLQQLSVIAENLASISGQHAHQKLLHQDQHLLVLDQFGGLMPQRKTLADHFKKLQPLLRHLEELKSRRQRQAEQQELLAFQKQEIEGADLALGEDERLERERNRLKNIERLRQTVFNGLNDLYDAPESIFERLSDLSKQFRDGCRLDAELESTAAALDDTVFRIEDIIDRLRRYQLSIDEDGTSLEVIEERLDLVNKLKRKYGGSLNAVLAKLEDIDAEMSQFDSLSGDIAACQAEIDALYARVSADARSISRKRKKAAVDLAQKAETELAELKMAGTRFHVALDTEKAGEDSSPYLAVDGCALIDTGVDRATFMLAPNTGEDLKPLAAIASGGELSRVVLALKAILARTDLLETVVFDEVDAGIGGGVAEMVGKKLARLSQFHQILCITHLPQIAKCGDHHFKIVKEVRNDRTTTSIIPLNRDARIEELARMLGGETVTPATLAHARELLTESSD